MSTPHPPKTFTTLLLYFKMLSLMLLSITTLSPENFTGVVRGYRPDELFLADAAQLGLAPGKTRLIAPEEVDGCSFSTHMFPLKFTLGYLTRETGCGVTVIGIQPSSFDACAQLSPEVGAAVNALAAAFRKSFAR